MQCPMLVKYNTCPRCWIFKIMNEPVMADVPAHHSHIKGICENDGEILWIQYRKVFRIKHRRSPSPTFLVFSAERFRRTAPYEGPLSSQIQVFQASAKEDVLLVDFSLGKQYHRLHMAQEDRKYVICQAVCPT